MMCANIKEYVPGFQPLLQPDSYMVSLKKVCVVMLNRARGCPDQTSVIL
jgi:hypothetical protein